MNGQGNTGIHTSVEERLQVVLENSQPLERQRAGQSTRLQERAVRLQTIPIAFWAVLKPCKIKNGGALLIVHMLIVHRLARLLHRFRL